jgi:hypothetical protein
MLVPLRSSENLFGGPAAIGGGSAERLRFIFQKEGRSSPAGRIGPRRLSGARGFVSGSTRYLKSPEPSNGSVSFLRPRRSAHSE